VAINYKYSIKQKKDVPHDVDCSCDETYTVASLAGLISAHNAGALDLEDVIFFCGDIRDYPYVPKHAPTLVREIAV
jgi:hypothetical protein